MRNEEIKAELAALRAEVVALAEARKQAAMYRGLKKQGIEDIDAPVLS